MGKFDKQKLIPDHYADRFDTKVQNLDLQTVQTTIKKYCKFITGI